MVCGDFGIAERTADKVEPGELTGRRLKAFVGEIRTALFQGLRARICTHKTKAYLKRGGKKLWC